MIFPDSNIENLCGLGYTEEEARFLYLVATHSGCFSARQYLAFTGRKSGEKNLSFTQKVLAKGHASVRLLLRNGRLYHLYSRLIYRALGHENLRNRREHSTEHIRSKLAILDFVLAHLDYRYLETESEKMQYFTKELGLTKSILPSKRYCGAIRERTTDRYFVDKFPMFFRPPSPVVNFTFLDPGWENLKSFENHLFAYCGLFGALRDVHLTYIAIRPGRFEAARQMFLSIVDRPPQTDPGEEVLHYFRLRKAWEAKKYALFSHDDIELLNRFAQQFAKHSCQERYAPWVAGQISDDLVRSQFHDLAPQRTVTFETELVGGQAALFEAKPHRKFHNEAETRVKARPNSTFRPPFRPVFAGEKGQAVKE